jgi:putative ABC transport system substrate-binding protein
MSRRLALLGLALGFASAIALLNAPRVRAADPAQRTMRLGYVSPLSPSAELRGTNAFWERLSELGYVRGHSLIVESRWAQGRIDRLPALMSEVIRRKVDVLVTYSTPGAVAAKNATSTVPIVVATMGDPVGTKLVTSLAHPGGNLTGLSHGYADVEGKWLELLKEAVPRLSTVAVISNPDHPMNRLLARKLEDIAQTRGLKVRVFYVRGPESLDDAFGQAGRVAQAVLVLSDPYMFDHQRHIVELATAHRLPNMYTAPEFVDAGGLMAHGPDFAAMARRAADYVDKIFKGANPADLPIEQPTQYVLVVNLSAAKALGLTIPESILLRADEVVR